MKNKAEQIIQSISEQLKTPSEIIQENAPKGITIIDERDGNRYRFTKIGDLWWCTENLRYLPEVSQNELKNEPRYYVYDYEGNDVTAAKATANYSNYGVLYNWEAAMQSCPLGTRLPTDDEWQELIDYYGGNNVAGEALKMKEFNALMGGYRNPYGSFCNLDMASFWSSTESSSTDAWKRSLYSSETGVGRNALNKGLGFSVRCVVDIKE